MTDWSTVGYALLPHPNQPLVLAQSGPTAIDLPNFAKNDRVWPWDTYLLKPILEEKVGSPINILRYIARHADQESRRMYSIHLVEPRNDALPSDATWQPVEAILEHTAMPAMLQEGLKQWQIEQKSGVIPERRAPWALPDWHAQVENWIADQVSSLGRGRVRDIQPVKSWSISCVLKVFTDDGLLYFKMARDLPLFANEGPVLTCLAGLYPGRVPLPIAFQPEQGWMLLDDFGTVPDDDFPLREQARLMQDFARLQIDSSQELGVLLAVGCKDRRLDALLSQIEPLLDDELILGSLTPEERDRLQQAAPRLRELLIELTSLSIPYALLHGDLHAGNVIPREGTFLYFDWTDAAVSHPLFDMIHIFREEEEAQKNTLQEAYLGAWEAHYSAADVRRAWELAGVLYGLYHAVSYQYIAHGIEELVLSELNFAYYFLRKLLAGLQQLDPG
ncbi:MAG TPA: aminoglycoside phosphotransferase family protein [Anaerolineales bacterium]|nr:aminoglycoside phosphotransferase family protein [Anaerolineales bacterium]